MANGRLGTSEARRRLSRLVEKAAQRTRPSRGLMDNAVEIGSYRRPGAVLIPEVDAKAHVEKEARLAQQVQALEEELDEIALGLLVADRIAARDRGEGAPGKPVERVARELGLSARSELRAYRDAAVRRVKRLREEARPDAP